MKLFTCLLSRSVLVAPVLIASLATIQAQAIERSVGCHEVAPVGIAPKRLTATLVPTSPGSELNGGISFTLAEDGIDVSGRLDGLDPNKRYRLHVAQPERQTRNAQNGRPSVGGDPENPVPPFSSIVDKDLGVLLADPSGGTVIKFTLKGVGLTEGECVVLGKSLILTEVPAEGSSGAANRVATATVQIPELRVNPVQQPSRLDELGPGERWF